MSDKKQPKVIQDPKIKAKVKREKRERFNQVWWFPLIALLIVAYVVVTHYTTRGTLVKLSFKSAEGLGVNKTKVKYKDVIIGKVESIDLNENLDGVKVGIRMNRASEGLLREKTRFWIVKPRLSVTQVTGLSTLISGFHITLDPDKTSTGEYRYEFEGLETAPIVTQDDTALNITLLANRASSLKPGTAVYFRGYAVGKVNRVYFSDDYLWVKADVSIESPHGDLIKPNTRFWSSNGIAISASSDGVDIQMESIETLIAGGITFDTPVDDLGLKDIKVENDTEFRVFASKEVADEENIGNTHNFVTYFDGNIQGLDEGAPVMIQGMKIGKVKKIKLMFDEELSTIRIPVLFEVYENNFNRVTHEEHTERLELQDLINRLLKKGLRTQIGTSSLITGKKHIALVFDEEAIGGQQVSIKIDPITKQALVPSTAGSFDEITSGVSKLISKVNALPLDEIMGNVNSLLSNTDKKIKGIHLDEVIARFNVLLENTNQKINGIKVGETLARINQLVSNTDKKINQLALSQTVTHLNGLLKDGKSFLKNGKSLTSAAERTLQSVDVSVTKLSQSAATTLEGYSADAPLYYNLNTTIGQLNETLTSLKTVLNMLDRHPNSLVFGEDDPKEPEEFYWESEKP